MSIQSARSVLAAAAAVIGTFAMTPNAQADEFSIDFSFNSGHGSPLNFPADCTPDRIYVEPVYENRSRQVWVEPVYDTRSERVWVGPIVENRCEEVWVPDRFATRVERVRDNCGRVVIISRQVLVERGHYASVQRQVVIREGFWHETPQQVCVSQGYFQTIDERVCVREGYWVERQTVVRESIRGGFTFNSDRHDDNRRDDYRPRRHVPDNIQVNGGDRFDRDLQRVGEREDRNDRGDRYRDRGDDNRLNTARAERDRGDDTPRVRQASDRSRDSDRSSSDRNSGRSSEGSGDRSGERSGDRSSDRSSDRGDRYRG